MDGFKVNNETVVPGFDQSPYLDNGLKFDDSIDLSFMDIPFPSPESYPEPGPDPDLRKFAPSSSATSELDSPDDHDLSDTVLKYLNQILMEENMEGKPSMFHDPLALQAAEKSFYEVLGEKYPPSPDQPSLYIEQNVESPNDHFSGSSIDNNTNSSSTCSSNFTDRQWNDDSVEFKSSSSLIRSNPVEKSFQSTLQSSSDCSLSSTDSFSNALTGPLESFEMVSNIFSDSQSILLFKRGAEEARKFLPSGNQFIIDLENYALPPQSKEVVPEVLIKVEKDERSYSPNSPRGRKNHYREDSDLEEERNSKQSALYVEESELSEMFDRVLLSTEVKGGPPPCAVKEEVHDGESKTLQQKKQSNGGKTRAKKQGNTKEVVDLRTLLVNCAHSVAADDRRTANEQLKQIRQHCSPFGDGSQRLAHFFANGLEARLSGTGSQIYTALTSKRPSAAHMLKAYQLYISASPFKTIAILLANLKILEIAEKATKLHIIDFGILYGFQWPILIQRLSTRPNGPPKLRITGIEFPQPGFRPAELVEETGRRLGKYCERFKVPFEYNAIAKKWETIQIEDFKIDSDEVLAVTALFKFKNLFDETVTVDSPRDAVLKLIRTINPNIFVHAVVNGSYSAPFYVTRFREALYHYSALYDMFDTNIPREDPERLMFEKEFFGREIMNVVACEGFERVERPETYKQWQVRNLRAGFRQLPLNQEVMKKLKAKVKAGCHKDFVIDEDGHWMVQGWKGRIVYASSCWVPA
ncbi:scarecrow-like protein 14 [Cornus florida]|uniref:scarecrow-like protein 14 n=1 Tax=Cornus florida TaxID=4283 RepID=UPI002897024B|nr:scarecrow-like protein 14 [Cornus florida]XP_059660767.1 scarecrow-like protein 14 [Cornus florida]